MESHSYPSPVEMPPSGADRPWDGLLRDSADLPGSTQRAVHADGPVLAALRRRPVRQGIIVPMAESVSVGTLTGLVDLYKADLDGAKSESDEGIAIHVVSHECVRVIALRTNTWAKRRIYITAEHEGGKAFSFGQWLSPEQFIIGLQSMFYPTDDQKELLSVCSTISAETLSISEDDGVTQKATVGRSVAFKENKKIKPIVSLQPYRTFSDIEQPASNFLFRLHQSQDGKTVQCMLTEADGGVWKQVAMQSIKTWFEQQHLGLPIIA